MMRTSDIDSIKAKYKIVGRDEGLNQALDTALQVARTDLSVLIQGENGVGKEVVPRIIHDHSPRKTRPYIAINCGSIPEGTIDSELFGHVKGAFTGAVADHDGYFAAANGGTLFLDEVGELPLSTQVRLLRVLETGEFIPVGSNMPRKTDVRIVAATNVNIPKAISQGRFREDLFYRLCTISIKIPPLRDRGDDVIRLFKKFAMETAAKYNIPVPLRLDEAAEQVMKAYKWPGNIRQLRNLAEQLSILCGDDRIITPDTLARNGITPGEQTTQLATIGGATSESAFDYAKERTIIFTTLNQLAAEVKALKEHLAGMAGAVRPVQPGLLNYQPIDEAGMDDEVETVATPITITQPTTISTATAKPTFDDEEAEAELIEEVADLNLERQEKRLIELALRRNRNRRKQTARELGISERSLYRKIKEYGLEE